MKKIMLVMMLLSLFSFENIAFGADIGRETLAKNDGWGSNSTGVTGGSAAKAANVYTVSNRNTLVNALGSKTNTTPKIIYIQGTIDLNVDDKLKKLGLNDYKDPKYDFDKYLKQYDPKTWGKKEPTGTLEEARKRSQLNQKARVQIDIPSNTTIVGVGNNAKVIGGVFLIKSNNVILRNIQFQDAYDFFPSWDPTDGKNGNWNSEYDNVSINGGTKVWIDHCTFNDGSRQDHTFPSYYGRKYQHHDGLLDITNQADYITLSYNHFHHHDKAMTIGSNDKNTIDDGKLRVTLHHNRFENIVQRAPRVRYGKVHIYNNYYKGSLSTKEYPFSYAWGIGKSSKIYAENNVIDVPNLTSKNVISILSGSELRDSDTLLNGSLTQKIGANQGLKTSVGWTPTLFLSKDSVTKVKSNVLSKAGVGKIN